MRNSDLTNGPCHYSIRYRSENWFYFCPALELQMKNTKQQTCELWNESFGLSQLGVRAPLSKWVKNHQLDQWNISYISVFIYIYIIYMYIYIYYIYKYIYIYYIYKYIIYIIYICICIFGMNIIVSYMDCKPRIQFFLGHIDSASHENSLRSQPLMVPSRQFCSFNSVNSQFLLMNHN